MYETRVINQSFPNPDQLSPAVWAYIGDAVYELFIREQLLAAGPAKTQNLHRQATARVRASFQAQLAKRLEPQLSNFEQEILRRGRNAKCGHVPTGSDLATYRQATAFEALIGYLYLSDQRARLEELLAESFVREAEILDEKGDQ